MFSKELKEILTKMCSYVEIEYPGDEFFTKPEWYLKYEWTEEQVLDFKKWLEEFISKNKRYFGITNKKQTKRYVENFVFMYGWKLKK